jgi:repressor LexA
MSGDELKRRREQLGMTQEQLAQALGVAPNTVARWERGERSIPPHLALALETIERRR